ncbi:MAG: hypothetical protein R6U57_12235 [Anaerolineales bacterium]
MEEENRVDHLTAELVKELFVALGFSPDGWVRNTFSPLVWRPFQRFSKIASRFDQIIEEQDFREAARWILPNFVKDVNVFGVEKIPERGPLLIASNHPGAYDALVIAASIPRSDLKIITSNIPYLKKLPHVRQHMIFSAPDSHIRMTVFRSALRHLKQGGALLVFARGRIDPDPAHMPGAIQEIENWSTSLGLFLRKVPETKLAITIVSGILAPFFTQHPLTMFRRDRQDKQRIAEFFQGIRQMLSPGEILLNPELSFSSPLTLEDFHYREDVKLLAREIIRKAQNQLMRHTQHISTQTV